MKRLVIYTALAAAAIVPATTGLLANASFSQTVPVRTPAQAQLLTQDSGTATAARTGALTTSPTSPTSVSGTATSHAEPGDDHGGDRDRTTTRTHEPGDDHGGDRDRTSRGSDDSDSSGKGSGGSGSDD